MAEALDMNVQWDEDSKTVTVGESQGSIQLRIDCLEQALDAFVAPKSPEEVALIWAQGLKERNAVIQYAVMSPALRQKYQPIFDETYLPASWSSPWVENYVSS